MRGARTSQIEINQIVRLRKRGHSLSEIRKITGKSNSLVSKYIQGVKILPRYYHAWKIKQGGSKARASTEWEKSKITAEKIVGSLNRKEKLLIAACLYWGEGTKTELNLSNTDPDLVRVFVRCLEEIGVTKDKLRITIRVYDDINKDKAMEFWSGIIGIQKNQILNVNVLRGKKNGKLQYGMCRIRVTKGAPYFKIIKSIIKSIAVKI